MLPTNLYIVRHGETEWNTEKRMQGHKDSPLTENGKLQTSWLGETLHDIEFDAIYASSRNRTKQTAEIVRSNRDLPIFLRDNLKEIYMGEWEGRLTHEVKEEYPEDYNNFWYKPNLYKPKLGETFYDVQNRTIPEINNIIAKHSGKNILIVTHTVTLKIIMSNFENRSISNLWDPPYIHPTSLSCVEIINDNYNIKLYGDTTHYR